MRVFLSLFVIAAVALPLAPAAPTSALAQERGKRTASTEPEIRRSEQILKWINDYRQAPEPDRLPDMVRAMGNFGLFRELESAGVYIGFIGGVIGSNPERAEHLVASMFPMPPEDQVVLIRAIAYSGLPDWKGLLGAFVERMPARMVLIRKYLYGDGKTLTELEPDEAYVIDVLWGYYFATGAAEPVRRIVGTLAWSNNRDSVEKLTIGSMSKWTLATNASREKDLLDILHDEMNQQPLEVRKPLREVIVAAETFEIGRIRKEALAAVEELKARGPESARNFAWWGQIGQTTLALGCVAAAAVGQVQFGIPCVIGGAVSSAALKYLTPSAQ